MSKGMIDMDLEIVVDDTGLVWTFAGYLDAVGNTTQVKSEAAIVLIKHPTEEFWTGVDVRGLADEETSN